MYELSMIGILIKGVSTVYFNHNTNRFLYRCATAVITERKVNGSSRKN